MNRRGFLARLMGGLATAALAAHMELGSLVPVLTPPARVEKWFYLVEVTDRTVRNGYFTTFISVQHAWLKEEELAEHGLKPEDFLSLEPGQHLGPARATLNGRDVEALGAWDDDWNRMRDMDRDNVTDAVTNTWLDAGEYLV
jgi:hypothetical protein